MGSDNLFHKRKERLAADFKRRSHTRQSIKRYLVVCEGTKTEPHYLKELLDSRLTKAPYVNIQRNDGVSPDRVLAHAQKLYAHYLEQGDEYDCVICVFDRDAHSTFSSTLDQIHNLGKPFFAVTSTPSFELWLLLHFGYTDAPFHAAGKKSVGDQVIVQLKKQPQFKNYNKGALNTFSLLKPKLEEATDHANKLRQNADPASPLLANPWTNMDQLVIALTDNDFDLFEANHA
jgi:RloB-like protein